MTDKLTIQANKAMHFGLLTDDVPPKKSENKTNVTENSKNDDIGEDDVFSTTESETLPTITNKVETIQDNPPTSQINYLTPVITNN